MTINFRAKSKYKCMTNRAKTLIKVFINYNPFNQNSIQYLLA